MKKYSVILSSILFLAIFSLSQKNISLAQPPSFEVFSSSCGVAANGHGENCTPYPMVDSVVVSKFANSIYVKAYAYDVSGVYSMVANIQDPNNSGEYMNVEYPEDGNGIMYDDGAHNDGASGDGVFGTRIDVSNILPSGHWDPLAIYNIDIVATDKLNNNSWNQTTSPKAYANIGSFTIANITDLGATAISNFSFSPSSPGNGTNVTFSATLKYIAAPSAPVGGKTVTFYDGTIPASPIALASAITDNVTGIATATSALSMSASGNMPIYAKFNGDVSAGPSVSSTLNMPIISCVINNNSKICIAPLDASKLNYEGDSGQSISTFTINGSSSPVTTSTSTMVTYSATLSSAVSGETITFYNDTSSLTLGTAITNSSGVAILQRSPTVAGIFTMKAVYNGSGGLGLAKSIKANVLTVTDSGNICANNNNSTICIAPLDASKLNYEGDSGQSISTFTINGSSSPVTTSTSTMVTYSATLSSAVSGETITFYNDTSSLTLGTAITNSSGVAILQRSPTVAGIFTMKAVYNGSGGLGLAKSIKANVLTVTDSGNICANNNNSTICIAPLDASKLNYEGDSGQSISTFTINGSSSPVTTSTSTMVTYSATLSSAVSGETITFYNDTSSLTLGTAITNSSGVAILQRVPTVVGVFTVKAVYGGSGGLGLGRGIKANTLTVTDSGSICANNNNSTICIAPLDASKLNYEGDSGQSISTFTINGSSSSTVSSAIGNLVTCSVTIPASIATEAGTLVSSVTFYNDTTSTVLGTVSTDASGIATTTFTPSVLGTYVIKAVYKGYIGLGLTPTIKSITLNVTNGTPTQITNISPGASEVVPTGVSSNYSATLKTDGGVAISGETINFQYAGAFIVSAVTDVNGVASINYTLSSGTTPGAILLSAVYGGNPAAGKKYLASTQSVTVNVVTPTITELWTDKNQITDTSMDVYSTAQIETRNQFIITASDLANSLSANDKILGIRLRSADGPQRNLAGFRVRMKLISAAQSTTTAWETGWASTFGPATISSLVNLLPNTWNDYLLSSGLVWDGSSNVMVDIAKQNTTTYSGGAMYWRSNVGTNRMFMNSTNITNSFYNATTGTNGTSSANCPVIKIISSGLSVNPPTATQMTLPTPTSIAQGGIANISAVLKTSGGTPILGATINFKDGATDIGSVTTSTGGIAALAYTTSIWTDTSSPHTITASYDGNSSKGFLSNQQTVSLTVLNTSSTIEPWANNGAELVVPASPASVYADVYNTSRTDARDQFIVLASELINNGLRNGDIITGLQLHAYTQPGEDLANFAIKMKLVGTSTQTTSWETGWTEFYNPAGYTLKALIQPNSWQSYVFNGENGAPAGGLLWDGTSNIEVDLERANPFVMVATGGAMYWRPNCGTNRTFAGYYTGNDSTWGALWSIGSGTTGGINTTSCPSVKINYIKVPATSGVATSMSLSVPSTAKAGSVVNLTATMSALGVTETVYFRDVTANINIGSAVTNLSGVATFSNYTIPLGSSLGNHTIMAIFAGNSTNSLMYAEATATMNINIGVGELWQDKAETTTGSVSGSYHVYSAANKEVRDQFVITAAELSDNINGPGLLAGDVITGIQLRAATVSTTPLANFMVRMKLTSPTTQTSTITWEDFPALTSGIYGPATTTPIVGWNEYLFSTPLTWNGTGNLLVDLERQNTTTGSGGTMYWRTVTGATNKTLAAYYNSTVPGTVYNAVGAKSGTNTNVVYCPEFRIVYTRP